MFGNELFSLRKSVIYFRNFTLLTLAAIFFTGVFTGNAAAQLNLDSTFSAGVTEGNANVYVTRPLADGKILVGGTFLLVNGVEKSFLVRLNADGSIDDTFNAGSAGANNGVYEIIQLSDGKFLIGGLFTAYNGVVKSGIIRINADGTLDTTFNPGGAGATGTVQTISLQPDGKILISGSGIIAYNGTPRFSVIRLNADGTLDASFTSPFTANQFVEEVDVQSDGKILVGGAFVVGSPTRIDIARLNADGSIDASFNPSGGGTDGRGVYALTIQADGKILIGGAFQAYNNFSRPGLARLNSDGSLDGTFNPNVVTTAGAEYFLLQPDGKILVAGSFLFPFDSALIRLNPDGSLDNTFVVNSANRTGYHVSRQPTDGKILLSGFFTVFNNQPRRNLVRLNLDGSVDNSFTASFAIFGVVNALAQQTDGKIIAGGNFNLANNVFRPNIARYNQDSSLDVSFNPGNGTSPDPSNAGNVVNDIDVQTDGKILVGGNFGGFNGAERRGIVRLNADGSVDNSFVSPFSADYAGVFVFDILALPDGKILVAGQFIDAEANGLFLLRLNSNGSIEANLPANSQVRAMVRQPDGKIVVGGAFTSFNSVNRNRIVRLNPDYTLDMTFNPGTGFSNGTVLDLVIQPDGKILAGGTFLNFNGTSRTRVARLNADGSLDTTFNPGTGADNIVWSIALQPNGKILIGGTFALYNGTSRNRLALLNQDGTLDTSFASGFDNDLRFFVRRLLTQTGGKTIVGGVFKSYNGIARNSLLRLSATRRTQFDYDGDGKADISVFRPSAGSWYLSRSSDNAFVGVQFGANGDLIAPADFDGDGKTDISVFRPADGGWYRLNSSNNTFSAFQFGANGDLPVPGDFDGDLKADLTVYRPSAGSWYRINSSNNQFIAAQFGVAEDKPLVGDFDGDGKSDLAVFRPSNGTWYRINSATDTFSPNQFGAPGDLPVAADYDGDGKTDLAVYRPSVGDWYIVNSSNSAFISTHFGVTEDKPAPADFDGDGKADLVVFRPSTGTWYLLRTTAGFTGIQFGANGDIPTPNAFVR